MRATQETAPQNKALQLTKTRVLKRVARSVINGAFAAERGVFGGREHMEKEHRNDEMGKQYDFSKARRTPYAARLKKQITIRLDAPTIEYFKSVWESTGIPYQTLINLYLRDCANNKRKLRLEWTPQAS